MLYPGPDGSTLIITIFPGYQGVRVLSSELSPSELEKVLSDKFLDWSYLDDIEGIEEITGGRVHKLRIDTPYLPKPLLTYIKNTVLPSIKDRLSPKYISLLNQFITYIEQNYQTLQAMYEKKR